MTLYDQADAMEVVKADAARRRARGPVVVRRKPTQAEAIRWTGDNFLAVERFLEPQHASLAGSSAGELRFGVVKPQSIATVVPGDWIMREADGAGFYPCAADVFELTYEVVA